MQAVEAGEHEERRAVDAGRQREAEFLVGLAVLVRLEADEREAQQEGEREEDLQHAALPARSAWCAIVTVTPLVSRIAVFSSGMPIAGMVAKVPSTPPTCAGPLVGQRASKCGHSSSW